MSLRLVCKNNTPAKKKKKKKEKKIKKTQPLHYLKLSLRGLYCDGILCYRPGSEKTFMICQYTETVAILLAVQGKRGKPGESDG